MVVKLVGCAALGNAMFESRVVLDGSQTNTQSKYRSTKFESRVVLDGSQT